MKTTSPHTLYRFVPPLMAGALALALYAATAAPWLTWAHHGADGGDLIAAAMTRGVPHPTGYPTYCLLGRTFALLPLGNVARRFALFSAVCAALAVAVVAHAAGRTDGEAAPNHPILALTAPLAALAWAVSPTLWSQAVITEVYAPAALFQAACLALALSPRLMARPRGWALLGLLLGLGLGMHLTLTLMAPGLAVLLWPSLRRNAGPGAGRLLSAGALGGLLGLAVFAYLPLAARANPPVNWGNPRTWEGFWWLVSGRAYHGYLGAPMAALPARAAALTALWVRQYTLPGLALCGVGLWAWSESPLGRRRALATALLATVPGLYALVYHTADAHLYLIPAYMVAALWLAGGARALADLVMPRLGHIGATLALLALAAIPIWSLAPHYPAMNLRHDSEAAIWVNTVLETLPAGALLVTGEDRHTFTMDYVLWVEGRRPDVTVVDRDLLQFPWYVQALARREPALVPGDAPSIHDVVAAARETRPVFLAGDHPDIVATWGGAERAVLWQVQTAH
jgi:hypothetical protein